MLWAAMDRWSNCSSTISSRAGHHLLEAFQWKASNFFISARNNVTAFSHAMLERSLGEYVPSTHTHQGLDLSHDLWIATKLPRHISTGHHLKPLWIKGIDDRHPVTSQKESSRPHAWPAGIGC